MLRVYNLHCGYTGKEVIHNISFELHSGDRLAILGANGSGKSTLLRALAAIIPSNKSIELAGQALETIPRRELAQKIALHSQQYTHYFNYTVQESVALGRYAHHRFRLFEQKNSEDYAMIARALAATDLTDQAQSPLSQLSGGQLQRVFLARTLAQDPNIILLDEPSNHLDLRHQLALMEYLNTWVAEVTHSLIAVHHDINLALQFSNKLLILKDGHCVFYGSPAELSAPILTAAFSYDVADYMLKSLARWQRFKN